jgi:hypothetical protein
VVVSRSRDLKEDDVKREVVYIGTALRGVLPRLHTRGQTYVGSEVVEALELEHKYWSGVGGSLIRDRLWFYFWEGHLVKWGQPGDWPAKPDLIMERRER